MSGIAGILLDLGYRDIIGIDSERSQLTDRLESRGLEIIYSHGKCQIEPGDIVIYSAAAEQSPEVQQAYALAQDYIHGMLVCNYFQFLGEISKYCRTLAIAGTNGKSTTTALALYAAKQHMSDM
jgi:UDP-N-acetylmuramate--alanine ligase